MGAILGKEYLIGLKKASEWGTAVACGANDGLLVRSESLKGRIGAHMDDSLGLIFVMEEEKGLYEPVGGAIEAYNRYEGLDVALALAMGIAGIPVQQEETAAYKHTLKLKENLDGLFATIAQLKQTDKVWETPSVKMAGFTIRGTIGAPLEISLPVMGTKMVFDSSVNTPTTMGNLTMPDRANRVVWNPSKTVIRMNDASGAALADGDKIYPNSFELAFGRGHTGDHTQHDYIDEPLEESYPTHTFRFGFPRYDAVNHPYFEDWDAFTYKKMDLTITGALIEETYYYTFTLLFPKLRVADPDAAVTGPGKIPATINMNAFKTDTAPEGMTGITLPFQLEIINKRSTDPLA